MGLQSTRLHHRLSVTKTVAENLYSEPIDVNVAGTAFTLPPKHSGLIVQDSSGLPGIKVGTAFIADDDHLVPRPMDFSKKNYMSMVDQQDLLIKLVRPDIEVGTPGLKLDNSMRMLLMEAMAQYPSQSANPKYDGSDYPDDFCKFFLPGLSRIRPKGALRIYNKIGRAYGFTIDNSYVFDVETGRSFFLTAVIYTNANGVLNDDRYEYEFADCTLADLAEVLGRALWQIPDSSANSSGPFDCTPSSLWTICIKPLKIPTFFESSLDTEGVEESKLPAKNSVNAVEQHLTEPTLTSSAENLSLYQSPVNFIGPQKESSSGSIMMRSGSICFSALQQSSVQSAQIGATGLPTTGDQHCNPLGHALPMLLAQVSSVEDVPIPPFAKICENSIKPCYKYFVDE